MARWVKSHHALIAALVALVVAIVGATQAPSPVSNQHIVNRAQGNLKARAVEAADKAANLTQNPSCNPPLGGGKLGACGPTQASAATNALAVVSGDPLTIHGALGVDVSSYQPAGVCGPSFCFYKASESTGYTDPHLRANVAYAKRAHKPYGVYDFLRPGRTTPEAEAAHFVAAVNYAGANTSLPPVADVEANAGLSPAGVLNYVCRWHSYVRRALHRPVTITYTGYWFYEPQVAAGSCGALLWISAYASTYYVPHGFAHAVIWQYSDGRYGPTPHLSGWDSDVWLGHGSESLAALSGATRYVAGPAARHQCRMHNHYAAWHLKYKRRRERRGQLGAFGTARLRSADSHLRRERHYFRKRHDHGHTNYDCLSDGHVRVRVL